jgi:hypothetical protein
MSVVPEIGKCYELTGKKTAWGYSDEVKPQYLGKYIGSEEQGSHDRYTTLKFQYDKNRVPGDQFRVTMCREEPDDAEIKRRAEEAKSAAFAAQFGQGRRRRKTRTRKHKRVSRKTRRYRK